MKRIVLILTWTAAVAYGQSGSPVDRMKLESLHDSGKAFQQALADPNATVGKVADLRMKLEHEATRFEGRGGSPAEKRIVEMYAAAARGYDAARNRFAAEKSREHFLADLRQIDTELSEAESLFQGGTPTVPAVAPPAAAAPVVPVPSPPPATPRVRKPSPPEVTVPATPPGPERATPPLPPPMPPAHSPEPPTHAEPPLAPPPSMSTSAPSSPPRPASPTPPAVAKPTIPPPVVPPPPAAPVVPAATPVTAEPVAPPPHAVAPPSEPIAPPAPVVEPRPASVAPLPVVEKPASAPPEPPAPPSGAGGAAPAVPSATAIEPPPSRRHGPPIVARGPIVTTPSAVRKAADKLRVETSAGAVVDRCSLLGEVATGDVRQGVYEIGGHNFLYDNALGLARLKTVEAGGDTLLIREKTKRSVTGDAYRCKSAD